MLSELSFRKKIILYQVLLFLAFFATLFPLIEKMSQILVRDSLIESTEDLKLRLEKANSVDQMVEILKTQQYYSFFRMSLINEEGRVIFDTHLSKLLGANFKPYVPRDHHEIAEALKEGVGYQIASSDTFGGKFAYVAERFPFQGKTFVLRTVFPYEQIQDLTQNFEIGVLIFTFCILLFFNALIWTILSRLTLPIREITGAIRPYQRGEVSQLPEIKLSKTPGPNDDFQKLANTLNSLSKRVEQQLETLRDEKEEKEAILESLGEGVVAVDSKLRVLYLNSIAAKMLSIQKKGLRETLFRSLADKKNQELFDRSISLLERCQEEGIALTDALVQGEQKKIYMDLIAAPKTHGTGAILVLQDKTHHYKVLEMGKDFVANASHELRTPITIIKGYSEALQDLQDIPPDMLQEITEKIARNCRRMESLVSSLLTLADIENLPDVRFATCDLIALLENCSHTLRSVYRDAEVSFEKREDKLSANVDAGLLELAFNNLLENAAKYSDPPAQIHISAGLSSEGEAEVIISDKGRGIPFEDLEHIFERFYRVDKTHSRRLGGAGLGLSLVKIIVEKHDGRISVTSKLGEGTTFTILIPLLHKSLL